MGQAAVDEAVRNVLCVGAEYGVPESVLALVDNFCWPDPVKDAAKAGALVRTAYGMMDAALGLGAPFVSGKDSMKNDYRGKVDGKDVEISVVPTLLVTAVARVPDIRWTRTADFKVAGDIIYLFGGTRFGLIGSELHAMLPGPLPCDATLSEPDWRLARNTYSWIGGTAGKGQNRLRSLHDVSDGGLLVSISESLIARGLGAQIEFPSDANPWELGFGEGFHGFVASVAEADAPQIESEWAALGVPYFRLGQVTSNERLEVSWSEGGGPRRAWHIPTRSLRFAWKREGYWE
jgi:phosphoribosylformylglycinamidine synthase